MILRRVARPQVIAKPFERLSYPSLSSASQRWRSLHTVPPLGDTSNTLGRQFEKNGVPGFLSSNAYKQTWLSYQKHLVDYLNDQTMDTDYANSPVMHLHYQFSHQPDHTALYNHAAMAHFNHLWWESLAYNKTEVPENLRRDIVDEFGTLEDLRNEMVEHADAMFGNGFVWLLKERPHNEATGARSKLRILCTYNAGSPYAAAWRMRQTRDSATTDDRTAGTYRSRQMSVPQNYVGSSGQYSQVGREGHLAPNALDALPLLCLNVWQHMWVPDYGILGKRQYLSAWWERVDWNVVQNRSNQMAKVGYQ